MDNNTKHIAREIEVSREREREREREITKATLS